MPARPRPILAVRLIGPTAVVTTHQAALIAHLTATYGDRATLPHQYPSRQPHRRDPGLHDPHTEGDTTTMTNRLDSSSSSITRVLTPRWYSPAEVAKMLGFGLSKVKMKIATGELRSVKDGKHRRILPEWVDEYIRDQIDRQEVA